MPKFMPKNRMKAIALVSGGIDSPVAAYLMMRKGVEVIPLYMKLGEFSDAGNFERAKKAISKLAELADYEMRAYSIEHSPALAKIVPNSGNLACILCKRMMVRCAGGLAKEVGAEAIITGEFLGSKASQTGQNLRIIWTASPIPLLRPLVGMNKDEIEKIAKKIGTFESNQGMGCCNAVPNKPSTRAKIKEVEEAENRMDVKNLVMEAVKNAREIKF
ncbi:MAG: 7-cyano-7-deazaguanine synthase [Candidatus Micrarchaeota archaeon]|nr:7-cyano-7-deazaguanine synthase [Candidatus Micrarchaeota archaeon]